MAIWGSASTAQKLKIKRFHNAPWYFRKNTLHIDLNMTEVATFIDRKYTKLHLTMRKYVNHLCKTLCNTCHHPE
jgi:hypothetical protein